MTREDALQMLRDLEPSKSERIAQLERTGFPGKFNPHNRSASGHMASLGRDAALACL